MDAPEEPTAGSTQHAEAFGAVSNEVRVEILRTLFEAGETRSFSNLRGAVGIEDSGLFNYHLGELEGRFVQKSDAGYGLTYAGRKVVGSIHSGIYTDQATMKPVDAGQCVLCDGQLQATYDDELAEVGCVDCRQTVSKFGLPPTLVDGFEQSELPLAFSRWLVTAVQRTVRGFCPDCSGRTRLSETMELRELTDVLGMRYTCEVCGLTVGAPLGLAVLDHPAVVEFHDVHGIDIRETSCGRFPGRWRPTRPKREMTP